MKKKPKYDGLVRITVEAKVTDDSRNKTNKIAAEYTNYQKYIQSYCKSDIELYSTTKVQAQRALKKIGKPDMQKEYPVILRNDLVGIQKDRKFEGVYWMKIPVFPKSIHLRIHTSEKYNLVDYSIGECKIIRHEDKEGWFILITLRKPDKRITFADNVLSVDLGVNNMAVTVNTANTKPNFYGKEIRGIRGHYFHLRRELGKKKAFYKIKELGNIEFLRIDHELHKISKAIVEEAERTNADIIIGKLKGIRKRLERIKPLKPNTVETSIFDKKLKVSRRVRRLINNFPYYALGQYIKYKAIWRGIRVVEISEAYTSQTCCKCGTRSKKARKSQGLYICKSKNCICKETNADYNAAMNLLQRGFGTLSNLGGLRQFGRCFAEALSKAKTELAYPKAACFNKADKLPMIVDRNKMIRVEQTTARKGSVKGTPIASA